MDQFRIKYDSSQEFLRSEIPEDIKYRKIKKMTFEDELKKVLPKDSNLCFHGTTIWNTRDILESGTITSRMDREGYDFEQVNIPNQISVTTINNLWFTVKQFADLSNYKYPAGSIFVISPKDEREYLSARDNNLIDNVDFLYSPDRLKAIITTPENVLRIQSWLEKSKINVNSNIVVDYDQAISLLSGIARSNDELIK